MRFGEEFGGDFEGVIRGGDAAVNGRVEENFLDFFARDAVVQSGTKMKAKFVLAIEGDGHGKSKKAARVAREAGARPNFAPGVARDEVLKGGCEVCGCAHGTIHMGVAENFAADFQSFFVAFTFVHRVAPRDVRPLDMSGSV